MLRTFYRSSKKIAARIKHYFAASDRIIFEIPDEKIFCRALNSSLIESLVGTRHVPLEENNLKTTKQIVLYFRSRESHFFISAKEIKKARDIVHQQHPEWVELAFQQADEMSEGYLHTYSQRARLLTPHEWAFVPLGPGKDFMYRQRPHRFGFAPRLAIAAIYGHKKALAQLDDFVTNWSESVQPERLFDKKNRSIKTSSHVSLYRIISVTWTLAFLSAIKPVNTKLEMLLLRILLADAEYMFDCLPDTTANNHLLADGFGLWYVGSLYPEFISAEKWKNAGFNVFKKELLRQIYRDGTSFEQSVHYQEHISEMGVVYLQLCRRNKWDVDDQISNRVKAMLSFQSVINGKDGKSLAIGDTTEDPLFPLDSTNSWCVSSMRAMNALFFYDNKMDYDTQDLSVERFFWLNAGVLPDKIEDHEKQLLDLSIFPDGGFCVFSNKNNQQNNRLVFRTGPSAQVQIVSGHMHSDYLNIFLTINGVPIFVPSGTYTYRGNPIFWSWPYPYWRDYFMSADSGNGLILSDIDPLKRSGGDFPGGVHGNIASRVESLGVSKGQFISLAGSQVVGESEYSGWQRRILQVNNNYWVVLDVFPTLVSSLSSFLSFQCYPGSKIKHLGTCELQIDVDNVQLILAYSHGLEKPNCLEGSFKRRGGWVSNSYGNMKKAPQILFPIKNNCTLSALVFCENAKENTHLNIETLIQNGSELELIINYDNFDDEIQLFYNKNESKIKWNRKKNKQTIANEILPIISKNEYIN